MINLSKDELEILNLLYHSSKGGEWLPFDNPSVLSLLSKGLIKKTLANAVLKKEFDYALGIACILGPLVAEILKEDLPNSQNPSA